MNQILEASTIEKSILAILKKLFNKGKIFVSEEEVAKIENYGKEILEQLNLEHLLQVLDLRTKNEKDSEYFYSFEVFLKIVKYFVLNQKEKDYLDRIQKEVEENERLETQVKELRDEVEQENKKRINNKELDDPNIKKLAREIESYENKLEKAHQRLNQTIF